MRLRIKFPIRVHLFSSVDEILLAEKRVAEVKNIVVEAGIYDPAFGVGDVLVFIADGYGTFFSQADFQAGADVGGEIKACSAEIRGSPAEVKEAAGYGDEWLNLFSRPKINLQTKRSGSEGVFRRANKCEAWRISDNLNIRII